MATAFTVIHKFELTLTWGVPRMWRAERKKKERKAVALSRRGCVFRFSRLLQSGAAIRPFDKALLMGCGKAFYHWSIMARIRAVNLR